MASNLIVEFKLLHLDAKRPEYKTDGASGMDLCAFSASECVIQMAGAIECEFEAGSDGKERLLKILRLGSGSGVIFGTSIAISIPQGWEAQIRSRSSLSAKGILCQLGTIDSDYRGELKVVLVNLSGEPFEIKRGDRIAQLVFQPVGRAVFQEVKEFSSQTARGKGGFGSTGA